MQLAQYLDAYLLELKINNKSERTIKNVKNNSTLFFKYVVQEVEIIKIEQLNKTHI